MTTSNKTTRQNPASPPVPGGPTKRVYIVTYADPASLNHTSAPALDICNAKPSKIVLAGKVPPLSSSSGKEQDKNSLPLSAGALAIGALAFGIAAKKTGPFNGYFDNYSEDLHTVADFITGGGSSSNNSTQNPSSNHTVVNSNTSSGTVTTSTSTDNSCASSSTACNGGAWLDSQLPHYHKP